MFYHRIRYKCNAEDLYEDHDDDDVDVYEK